MSAIDKWTAVFSFIMCDISQLPSLDGYLRTLLFGLPINSRITHLELLLENEMGFSVFKYQIDSKWIGGRDGQHE